MAPWTLVWDESYRIGVEQIDQQHQYFVNMFNVIKDRIDAKVSPEILHHTVQEMYYYLFFHFYSEENLMRETRYPGLADQQRSHQDFLAEFTRRIQKWNAVTTSLYPILEYLFKWFIGHIADDDVAIGVFLRRHRS